MFAGRLSKAWGQAMLYDLSGAKWENKLTMMARWIIKQLLHFSLEIWGFRNRILHGVTVEEQRRKFTELLRQQAHEACEYYHQRHSIISCHNQYLFERKTLEQRLQGDDDAMLGWLEKVEVAMATYWIEKGEAMKQAEKFFQPLREAGKRKWVQRQRYGTIDGPFDTLAESTVESLGHPMPSPEHRPSSKASEQFLTEVPGFLRYELQKKGILEVVNLADLFSD